MTTYARTCEYCRSNFEAKRQHARFCSDKCRVYNHLYGSYSDRIIAEAIADAPADDTTLTAAIAAAHIFTRVIVPDTKSAQAIRVDRTTADPNSWHVTVPTGSTIAAGRIAEAMLSQIGDLLSLANKLAAAAGEGRMTLRSAPKTRT